MAFEVLLLGSGVSCFEVSEAVYFDFEAFYPDSEAAYFEVSEVFVEAFEAVQQGWRVFDYFSSALKAFEALRVQLDLLAFSLSFRLRLQPQQFCYEDRQKVLGMLHNRPLFLLCLLHRKGKVPMCHREYKMNEYRDRLSNQTHKLLQGNHLSNNRECRDIAPEFVPVFRARVQCSEAHQSKCHQVDILGRWDDQKRRLRCKHRQGRPQNSILETRDMFSIVSFRVGGCLEIVDAK